MLLLATSKQIQYKDCPILIRQKDKICFEYVLVYNKKFYGFSLGRLKWYQYGRLLKEKVYSDKEVNIIYHFLEKAAESTIETLIKEDGKKDL